MQFKIEFYARPIVEGECEGGCDFETDLPCEHCQCFGYERFIEADHVHTALRNALSSAKVEFEAEDEAASKEAAWSVIAINGANLNPEQPVDTLLAVEFPVPETIHRFTYGPDQPAIWTRCPVIVFAEGEKPKLLPRPPIERLIEHHESVIAFYLDETRCHLPPGPERDRYLASGHRLVEAERGYLAEAIAFDAQPARSRPHPIA